ncbi:MAG: hypothetical protein Q8K99_12365 [Actinomycetota bacterium]|nr:hypothetical protein [Actinomycetota bacterium]
MVAHGRFTASSYLVRRKILKLAGGAFHVYDTGGTVVAFSEQKAFKLKEDIRVFTDESKTTELLSIQARQIMDFSAAYDVTDSSTGGEKIGALRRMGGRSLLRDEWQILDANDAQIGTLIEDSMGLALIRRFLSGLVPQRYDVFFPNAEGTKVANMDQNFNPFVYKLAVDFSMDSGGVFDRRLGIAAAILLAAIEGRQS